MDAMTVDDKHQEKMEANTQIETKQADKAKVDESEMNKGETQVNRKRKRKLDSYRTQLCRHFDKPNGCPFPNCKFAHGTDEKLEGGDSSLEAQRRLLREQTAERQQKDVASEDKVEVKPFVAKSGAMIDRYYTRLYTPDRMQYVHMHSNRLCVVGISPEHPVVKDKQKPVKVSFEVGKNGENLLDKKVRGKKKKGGAWLNPETLLCCITCEDGSEYFIRSGIRASLLEPNERLLQRPELLTSSAGDEGFIAIIRPKLNEIVEIQNSLLDSKQYQEVIASNNKTDRE